jgi:hypothetical protein
VIYTSPNFLLQIPFILLLIWRFLCRPCASSVKNSSSSSSSSRTGQSWLGRPRPAPPPCCPTRRTLLQQRTHAPRLPPPPAQSHRQATPARFPAHLAAHRAQQAPTAPRASAADPPCIRSPRGHHPPPPHAVGSPILAAAARPPVAACPIRLCARALTSRSTSSLLPPGHAHQQLTPRRSQSPSFPPAAALLLHHDRAAPLVQPSRAPSHSSTTPAARYRATPQHPNALQSPRQALACTPTRKAARRVLGPNRC